MRVHSSVVIIAKCYKTLGLEQLFKFFLPNGATGWKYIRVPLGKRAERESALVLKKKKKKKKERVECCLCGNAR